MRIVVSAAVFDALRRAELLEQIPLESGEKRDWPIHGWEREEDGMVICILREGNTIQIA